jgi:hypothetical protein
MQSYPAFTVVQVETVLAKIDEWGTVTVPAGTFECLRLQTNWTEVIYTIVDEIVVDSDTSIGLDFSWMSKTSMELADFIFEAPNYFEAEELRLLMEIGPGPIEKKPLIIDHFSLKQNYPNPFNPTTIINYELPMINDVRLTIYNLRGLRIATLVSEKQVAAKHQVEWDASEFASGVYYYKLTTGSGFSQTKKMILIQ